VALLGEELLPDRYVAVFYPGEVLVNPPPVRIWLSLSELAVEKRGIGLVVEVVEPGVRRR
jgi:hypothetical protein